MLKKAVIAALLLIFVTAAASCGAPISDDELQSVLSELIPKSEELNEIFWGRGIPPLEGVEIKESTALGSQYERVSADSPYQTVNDLMQAAANVYSTEFLNLIYEIAFYGTEETYPRYNESTDGALQVNVQNQGFNLRTKLNYEQAKVRSAIANRIKLMIPATYDGEPYPDVEVIIVNENGKWLLDSATY